MWYFIKTNKRSINITRTSPDFRHSRGGQMWHHFCFSFLCVFLNFLEPTMAADGCDGEDEAAFFPFNIQTLWEKHISWFEDSNENLSWGVWGNIWISHKSSSWRIKKWSFEIFACVRHTWDVYDRRWCLHNLPQHIRGASSPSRSSQEPPHRSSLICRTEQGWACQHSSGSRSRWVHLLPQTADLSSFKYLIDVGFCAKKDFKNSLKR